MAVMPWSGLMINEQPKLTVRLLSYPESNGKRNWTASIVRVEQFEGLVGTGGGITIDRGEYWNRVAYSAERAKFLLGERGDEPFILDYGVDICTPEEWSGENGIEKYKKPPKVKSAVTELGIVLNP